jgi:hypothetical protein
MTRRLAALGQVHQVYGYPNPCADQLVKELMRGARRNGGSQLVAMVTSPQGLRSSWNRRLACHDRALCRCR